VCVCARACVRVCVCRGLLLLLGFTRSDHQRYSDIRERLKVMSIFEGNGGTIKSVETILKEWKEATFRKCHSGTDQWDGQNDTRESKTTLGFIGTGLNNLPLQYS
jgi:hypothetical protein